jgi:hypothetical protein
MAYHIQRPSRIDKSTTVYYAGNGRWTDDPSQKESFSTKSSATSLMNNPDGKNGGWTNATIVNG